MVFDSSLIGFGLNHYLVTGQSLAYGAEGFFGISNTQPFSNKMFGPGNIYNLLTLGNPDVTLVPLISGPYVREAMGNGFADSLTAQARAVLPEEPGGPTSYDCLITNSGVPGYVYQQLCGPTDWNSSNPYWAAGGGGTAGSPPFQEMMSQVANGQSLAQAAGLSYRVAGLIVIHGEFDLFNPSYSTDLVNWQADVQDGVQNLTGQTAPIPMIAAQTQAMYDLSDFSIGGAAGLYNAALANPAKIVLACPEYAIQHHLMGEVDFGLPTEPIHLTADGYRHLGMMMAKAGRTVTMQGRQWSALTPTSFSFSGNQIVVEHSVPYPPVVLDYDWVTDPGNSGYIYTDNVDPTITITNVEVTSPTAVTITLSEAITGGVLGYACFPPPTDPSYNTNGGGNTQDYGPTRGPRGCLRDSDPEVPFYAPSLPYYVPSSGGPNQYPMQNYCVAYPPQTIGACISAQPDVNGGVHPARRC